MTVPATDAAREPYDAAVKHPEVRFAIETAPRMWSEEMFYGFDVDGELDPAEFYYTQFGGLHPQIISSNAEFACYGGPPRETIVTRKHWFPEDPTKAFEAIIVARYEMLDPVYPSVFTVGGITQFGGVDSEPMRVIQKGSAHVSGANIGKVFVNVAGALQTDANAFDNDQTAHTYLCRWNPAATGVAGDHILTVEVDGLLVHETSNLNFISQPRYIALNMICSTIAGALPTGTKGSPFFTLLIDSINTRTFGGSIYEDVLTPDWTYGPEAADIDAADDGERFPQGGTTWAKLPVDHVVNWAVTKGRDVLADTFTITLAQPASDAPDEKPNIFHDMRWKNRTVVIDTRIIPEVEGCGGWEDGDPTDWRRQICGVVEDVTYGVDTVTISGRDRVSVRLDTFLTRAFLNVEQDGDAVGEIEGVNVGYTLSDIFHDFAQIADAVHGGSLNGGVTSTSILVPDILPQALSSGGESLLPLMAQWCDTLGLEMWRRYSAVSGNPAEFGELMVELWTGTEIPEAGEVPNSHSEIYTFVGRPTAEDLGDVDQATDPIFTNVLEASVSHGREGVGQAFMRQSTPYLGTGYAIQSLEFIPTIGQFPTVPYPITDRIANDSIGPAESTGLSTFINLQYIDETPSRGGVARHRYRRENEGRRILTLKVENHDWIDPIDWLQVIDSRIGWAGLKPYDADNPDMDTWVVNNLTIRGDGERLETELKAAGADYVYSILMSS